ncbi:MAG: hypothetical protein KME45_00265 [Stenomitos rutilans HA7619-LM2]|jgi:hypothetical protein|nr:hypothetical protein [Stenomitos rutilans HA7619-LM2]
MLTPYITKVIDVNRKAGKIALALADESGNAVHVETVPSLLSLQLTYLLVRHKRTDVPKWSSKLEHRLQREFRRLADQGKGRSAIAA